MARLPVVLTGPLGPRAMLLWDWKQVMVEQE